MSLEINFFTKFFGNYVGEDDYGNKYYENKKQTRFGQPRRWVLYRGHEDASKVPAEWHGWLHHTNQDPPTVKKPVKYGWMKQHLQNMTGTKFAYKPKGWCRSGKPRLVKDYTPWQPE